MSTCADNDLQKTIRKMINLVNIQLTDIQVPLKTFPEDSGLKESQCALGNARGTLEASNPDEGKQMLASVAPSLKRAKKAIGGAKKT